MSDPTPNTPTPPSDSDKVSKYVVEAVCTNCGKEVLNTTKQMDAGELREAWTMIVMSAGFSTPRCPKCSYKTFSDLNIGTRFRIRRLATNGIVSFNTIEKEATA